MKTRIDADGRAWFTIEYITDISVAVYRQRLCDGSGPGADLRMIEEDGDDGKKLRNRAEAYNVLTRAYLKALNIKPEDMS